ncbi:MAG: CDP-diacylglycerol--glycerol-3-phosphate 3-phosphatidyltransferase [PVC group bacterium]|nr:CDP-diacylglycerol--glycerol-3-phosphate 3-phosphatidyltransferase [PVC group bacterium]
MNLPNKLTILRIFLTFVFMFLLFYDGLTAKILAFLAFTLASITDFYDGYLARKYNMITDLGKLLDPIADKILVLAAFLAFVEMGIIPAWMVAFVILRELLITGMRVLAANKGNVLAAAKAGKHKTVSQIVSIFLILGFIVIKEAGIMNMYCEVWFKTAIYVFMLITVAFTLISGLFYIKKNRKVFMRCKD